MECVDPNDTVDGTKSCSILCGKDLYLDLMIYIHMVFDTYIVAGFAFRNLRRMGCTTNVGENS